MSTDSVGYASYLLDRAQAACRRQGYSKSTESAYLFWIREFIDFCGAASIPDVDWDDADAFLSRRRDLATSSQNQAQTALRFLYDTVLEEPVPAVEIAHNWIGEAPETVRGSSVLPPNIRRLTTSTHALYPVAGAASDASTAQTGFGLGRSSETMARTATGL